jgi:hypothetical protein
VTSRHLIPVVTALFAMTLPAAPALASTGSVTDTAPAPVVIDIQAAHGSTGVTYLINLQNNTEAAAPLVVLQRFAHAPASLAVSGEGKAEAGAATWALEIPAKDLNRVSSEAVFGRKAPTLSTVCVADAATQRVLDCASGDLPTATGSARKHRPVWTVVIGAVLAGVALTALIYAGIRGRRRWWPALVRWAEPRQSSLAVVGAGLAVLITAAIGFLAVAGSAKPFLAAQAGTAKENIGWAGDPSPIEVGRPGHSRQAEFTVYQWSCGTPAATQAEAAPLCTATIAIRNVTKGQIGWVSRMQRLQQKPEGWLEPDIEATVAANGGIDPFAAPLNAGERRFASLVYKPQDPATLTRLELREGAFAAGVSLDLK